MDRYSDAKSQAIGQALNGASTVGGQSARPTLLSATEAAGGVARRLDGTAEMLGKIADHAQDIATRLAGSYPTDASAKGEGRDSDERASRGPQSSVDAINASVRDLFPKIDRLDPSLSRLAQALDMIERAVG